MFLFNNLKVERNILNRKLFFKFEKKRLILKSLLKSQSLLQDHKTYLYYYFFKFPRKSYLTTIFNFCIFTGRSRAVVKFFRVSRLEFKRLVTSGFITSYRKYSW